MAFGNTVQARVDLDISPFRRGLLSAQSELGKFSTKLSSGKVLTSILTGVGIGSGFAIAEKAAQFIAGYWEKAAKSAEAVAAHSEKQLDHTLRMLRLRRTDEQNAAVDLREEQSLRAQAARLEAGTTVQVRDRRGRLTGKTRTVAASEDDLKRARELTEKANDLEFARAQREKKAKEDAAEADKKRLEEEGKLEEALAKQRRADLQQQIEDGNKLFLADQERRKKEREEKEKDIADLRDKQKAADADVAKARGNLAQGLRDQSGATLDEIRSGSRGSSADQAKARQIARLRERSQRYRDDPNLTLTTTDQQGNRTDLKGGAAADELNRRANTLQGSIGSLTSSESDPLKAYKDALAESEKLLGEIKSALTASGTS